MFITNNALVHYIGVCQLIVLAIAVVTAGGEMQEALHNRSSNVFPVPVSQSHSVTLLSPSLAQSQSHPLSMSLSDAALEISDWPDALGPTTGYKTASTGLDAPETSHSQYNIDILSSCDAFIDLFSEMFANYSKCVVLSARPLQFCHNCVEQYVKAKAVYENMMNKTGKVRDAHGSLCGTVILNSDRIQIIVRAAHFIDNLWSNCHCSNCYESFSYLNYTILYKLTNKTEAFFQQYSETITCFQNYSQGHIVPSTHYVNITNSTVCLHCNEAYDSLNRIYTSIEKDARDTVCMDIVDAMNFTRMMWSRDFQCRRGTSNDLAVMLLTALFSMLPVAFYIGTRMAGSHQERRIVTQKRMKNVALTDELTESLLS